MDNNIGLSLVPIKFDSDFKKQWNLVQDDYMSLYRDGKPLNDNIYRRGGLGGIDTNEKYFCLEKYEKGTYSNGEKCLIGKWAIIDRQGNEKVRLNSLQTPYLVKGSSIYSVRNGYYNIETGEHYCCAYSKLESKDYIFLENHFDKDLSRRGIMRINKHDRSFKIYK